MEAATIKVYVSPYGKDSAPGTLSQPVQTLGEALARSRSTLYDHKNIILRGGNYYDVSLMLTDEDANLTFEAYPGEKPVIYGGIPIKSWEKEDDFYTAKLEGVSDRTRDFRVIEVNGQIRHRARLPEKGAFQHANEFPVPWLSTFAGGWARKPTEAEMTLIKYAAGDIDFKLDVNNAELTLYHEWDESLVGLKSMDPIQGTMRVLNPPGHPPGAFADRNENAKRYVVWNVKEGLKQPGQWYLDRTNGKLVYWPLPSEDMLQVHVVAPTRERIIHVHEGAKRLQFKGLTFACSATQLAAGGFAATEAEAAIFGEGIEDILFEEVTVRHAGGWAFRVLGNNIRFEGCHIHDTGAGGIHLNGERIVLRNNQIHHIGWVYQSAVAILSGGTGNTISHNEIHHTPYSGIIDVAHHTLLEWNLIYKFMTFSKDGGAIYCTGNKHVMIRNNAVFSDPAQKERRYAYYLDELCEDCTVANNLAVNTRNPVLSHMTRNCTIRNNIFIDDGLQIISAPNTFGLAFERNIIIADGFEFYAPKGNSQGKEPDSSLTDAMKPYSLADGITSMIHNIFNCKSEWVQFKEYLQYKVIHEFAVEQTNGNVFADPLLKDPAGGDFNFAPQSPAIKSDIIPLSFIETGCTSGFIELLKVYYHL